MKNLTALLAALLLMSVNSSAKAQFTNAFTNLSFSKPVLLTHAPDTTDRIFLVSQTGQIHVFPNDSLVPSATEFLDISDSINTNLGEQGLLGLAFHPNYAQNGYFYVNYTTGSSPNRRTVIARYSVDSININAGDPASEFILLEINQPFANHNGGMIEFGPDGYLYIGMGDGGSGGDPQNHGQNRTTLLGAMLRIDVDTTTGGLNYGIPPDNPYVGNGQGYREEIWAYGLRNPWRFSFDSQSGDLWAGDVGQNAWEEVDLIKKGHNFGWRIMEGFHCYNPPSGCDTAGLTLPHFEFSHGLGFSVTGGYVYRGSNHPGLVGKYIFGDYGSGRIWALEHDNGVTVRTVELDNSTYSISSFGVDQDNELYFLDYFAGTIYRFADNPAPLPFSLMVPADGDTVEVQSGQLFFSWSGSTDPDGDPVKYRLFIEGPRDTIVENITDTTHTFTNTGFLDSSSDYRWFVIAEDPLLAAQSSQDTFDLHTTSVLSVDEPVPVPEKVTLLQNFPNPFNPVTTIRYRLLDPKAVVLDVYNVVGQKIKTLDAGFRQGGEHVVSWDGTNSRGLRVSSGVYWYRLKAGNTVRTRKMLLLR